MGRRSLFRMNERGFAMKRARRVPRAQQIVTAGLVNTGSEWDGWHIRDVYKAIRGMVGSDGAALDHTRSVWENRVAAYREGKINYQAGVKSHEYEPEPGYFEEEVI